MCIEYKNSVANLIRIEKIVKMLDKRTFLGLKNGTFDQYDFYLKLATLKLKKNTFL